MQLNSIFAVLILELVVIVNVNAYSIRHVLLLVRPNDQNLDSNSSGYYFQRRTRNDRESVSHLIKSIMLTPNMRRIARNVGDGEEIKRADFHRTGGAIIIGR